MGTECPELGVGGGRAAANRAIGEFMAVQLPLAPSS